MATPKLDKFTKRLNKFKKTDQGKAFEDMDRHTYCTIVLINLKSEITGKSIKPPDKGGLHRFEVRGWRRAKIAGVEVLDVSAVNWTLTAGACSVDLTEDNIDDWDILEDNQTLRILYDYKG